MATPMTQEIRRVPADAAGEPAGVCSDPSQSRANRVLAGLPRADLALLAEYVQIVSLGPGEVLERQDHPLEYAYFPHEGLMSLLAEAPDGAFVEAGSIGRGGAFCPICPGDEGTALSPVTAVAQTTMCASRIDAASLQIVLRKSEALNRALSDCRHTLVCEFRQNLLCFALHRAGQRLSRWLLERADRLESDSIVIPVSQAELSERLGIRRTTVTVLAGKLQDVDAIRWRRSRVEIVDRTPLEATACSCYAALRGRMNDPREAAGVAPRGSLGGETADTPLPPI